MEMGLTRFCSLHLHLYSSYPLHYHMHPCFFFSSTPICYVMSPHFFYSCTPHFLSLHPFFVFQLGLSHILYAPLSLLTPTPTFYSYFGFVLYFICCIPPLINTPHLLHVPPTNYSYTLIFYFLLSFFN